MRSAEELNQLRADPKVQNFLRYIQTSEGVKHGYNTLFGNEQFDDLSKHPGIKKRFKQTDGKKNTTTAAGAYQFLESTWNELAKRYKLKDFSPESQDIGALGLLDRNGALDDILAGNYKNAVEKSGKTWASFPSSKYAQNKRSWEFTDRFFGAAGGQPLTEDQRLADNISTKKAQDLVEGTLAGMAVGQPIQVGGFDSDVFSTLRREQLAGEADRLALASLDNEANATRANAVRLFTGQEPLAVQPVSLPAPFEEALNRSLNEVG